jgi:hypothetical protein
VCVWYVVCMCVCMVCGVCVCGVCVWCVYVCVWCVCGVYVCVWCVVCVLVVAAASLLLPEQHMLWPGLRWLMAGLRLARDSHWFTQQIPLLDRLWVTHGEGQESKTQRGCCG